MFITHVDIGSRAYEHRFFFTPQSVIRIIVRMTYVVCSILALKERHWGPSTLLARVLL